MYKNIEREVILMASTNVTYERQNKIREYTIKMTQVLSNMYPDKDRRDIAKLVRAEAARAYAETRPTVLINGDEVPVNHMDTYITDNDLLVSGSGSLYIQHDQSDNILTKMIAFLKQERERYKGLMFEAMDAGDDIARARYNTRQLTIKVFNNSLYGVLTQANSIFFNPLSGPAITQSGQDIITTSVIAFERFLADNIFMDNVNDAFVYMNNILAEKYQYKHDVEFKFIPTVKMVKDRILGKVDSYTDKEEVLVEKFLRNQNDKNLTKIYYKNNLIEFINDTNLYEDYMQNIVARDDFLDPNSPPKEIKDELHVVWEIIEENVFYNHSDYHRFRNMMHTEERPRKRKAVLVIDTDSNFLQLNRLVELLSIKQGKDLDTIDMEHRMTIINTLMYVNTNVINEIYHKFTNKVGIHDDQAPLIVMDNEYYYSRLMLTRNKKNYAGIVLMREGHMVNPDGGGDLDMKGLAIRKVSTNSKARDVFEEILDNDILKAKDVNIPKIIQKYKNFEEEIYNSLKTGSADYASPAKANSPESYKMPFSIAPFRGALLWNKLFPQEEIVFPARVLSVKLNLSSIDQVYEVLDPEDPEDEHFFNVLEEVLGDEDMLINGRINTIAIPIETKMIPEFLVPFVDVDTIVNDTIKPGLIMLESLGIRLITSSNGNYPSTVVTL